MTAKTNIKTVKAHDPEQNARAMRETIESIVIAIILAFLFRTFEAEAFVIPTGSMAPTLQGRHKDVTCPKCGYGYRTGASGDTNHPDGAMCPICRYVQVLNPKENPNQDSFSGDRILVSKFAYQIADPQRWDPIVFKFPGNAKQNYIKRLVGLPNEKIRIRHGDIFIKGQEDAEFHIARKPPHKLQAMLQVVDDTNYLPEEFVKIGWPTRWQPWSAPEVTMPAPWKITANGHQFSTTGEGGPTWLRYRHLVARAEDWNDVTAGNLPDDIGKRRGQLITDFYTYNTAYYYRGNRARELPLLSPEEYDREVGDNMNLASRNDEPLPGMGNHWVGDLAMDCVVDVQSAQGAVLLSLIEGGVHYQCRIDVASGMATLSIDEGRTPFVAASGEKVVHPEAKTNVVGPGKYRLRLANCDDELLLWMNGSIVKFNSATTYANRPDCAPRWSVADPGDLAPAGVGSDGAALTVSALRILRDVYYIAGRSPAMDYDFTPADLYTAFTDPETWDTTKVFAARGALDFETQADQFFPLGDNSPQSQDARSWDAASQGAMRIDIKNYVERDLLIGKALMIYWPHAWKRPVPFTPNVQRMGVIR